MEHFNYGQWRNEKRKKITITIAAVYSGNGMLIIAFGWYWLFVFFLSRDASGSLNHKTILTSITLASEPSRRLSRNQTNFISHKKFSHENHFTEYQQMIPITDSPIMVSVWEWNRKIYCEIMTSFARRNDWNSCRQQTNQNRMCWENYVLIVNYKK